MRKTGNERLILRNRRSSPAPRVRKYRNGPSRAAQITTRPAMITERASNAPAAMSAVPIIITYVTLPVRSKNASVRATQACRKTTHCTPNANTAHHSISGCPAITAPCCPPAQASSPATSRAPQIPATPRTRSFFIHFPPPHSTILTTFVGNGALLGHTAGN